MYIVCYRHIRRYAQLQQYFKRSTARCGLNIEIFCFCFDLFQLITLNFFLFNLSQLNGMSSPLICVSWLHWAIDVMPYTMLQTTKIHGLCLHLTQFYAVIFFLFRLFFFYCHWSKMSINRIDCPLALQSHIYIRRRRLDDFLNIHLFINVCDPLM